MVITLPPPLEAALTKWANQRGELPEALAVEVLQQHIPPALPPFEPRDEWERRLFGAAIDCGVSVSDEALSSEGLYE